MAKAFDGSRPEGQRWRDVDENDVVVNGVVVGRDPDPNIRAALLREYQNNPMGTSDAD